MPGTSTNPVSGESRSKSSLPTETANERSFAVTPLLGRGKSCLAKDRAATVNEFD
jgi:hypothetical protein